MGFKKVDVDSVDMGVKERQREITRKQTRTRKKTMLGKSAWSRAWKNAMNAKWTFRGSGFVTSTSVTGGKSVRTRKSDVERISGTVKEIQKKFNVSVSKIQEYWEFRIAELIKEGVVNENTIFAKAMFVTRANKYFYDQSVSRVIGSGPKTSKSKTKPESKKDNYADYF